MINSSSYFYYIQNTITIHVSTWGISYFSMVRFSKLVILSNEFLKRTRKRSYFSYLFQYYKSGIRMNFENAPFFFISTF